MEKYQVESKKKSALRISCQTPGLVLSLRVDFVLPLSQEGYQQQQQEQEEEEEEEEEEPSPKSIIITDYTNFLKGF